MTADPLRLLAALLIGAFALAGCPASPGAGPGDDDAATTPIPTPSPSPSGTHSAQCGNGILESGELCDEGLDNGAFECGCTFSCTFPDVATACDDGSDCTRDDRCDGLGLCAPGPVDCDDGDPCTVDVCDATGITCENAGFSGVGPGLYDPPLIRDPATLDLQVIATTTEQVGLTRVRVQEIRYLSWEYEGCERRPIDIEAYVAMPESAIGSAGALPGLVKAHGLGGLADARAAAVPAGELGVVALAYSGPGQGASQGTGSVPDHLFDTASDPRNSWFWEHAAAAMRGLTVLEQIPEVDTNRLAMTGYSGGAVATHMVNGTDDRIRAAVAVSGTGHLDQAVDATPVPGWEADLLAAMTPPRTSADPEWLAYDAALDPKHFLPTAKAPLLLINGAQDEFFPLNTSALTLRDLNPAHPHRSLIIKDWDHGWFALFNDSEPAERASAAHDMWFDHHLDLSNLYDELPPQPSVDSVQPWVCIDMSIPLVWDCALVTASLLPPTGYTVGDVRFHWSVDGALTFFSWNLQEAGPVWAAEVGTMNADVTNASNTVWFAEFELWTDIFGIGPRFRLTSTPHIHPGFVPNILPIDGPLPL